MVLESNNSVVGYVFQDPHWMPKTEASTKTYIYYAFPYAYIRDEIFLGTVSD